MACWIFVTGEKNWPVIRDKGVYGMREKWKGLMQRVRPGDQVAIYLKARSKDGERIPGQIVGIFEVVSEPFVSRERVFKGDIYPLRVKLKSVICPSIPIEFKALVTKLKFVKNKQKFSGYFRRGIIEIPKEDFETIKKELISKIS